MGKDNVTSEKTMVYILYVSSNGNLSPFRITLIHSPRFYVVRLFIVKIN